MIDPRFSDYTTKYKCFYEREQLLDKGEIISSKLLFSFFFFFFVRTIFYKNMFFKFVSSLKLYLA